MSRPYLRLHAIGVGMSRYADPQYDLDYARSDAAFFVDVLRDEFGFDRTVTLFDADATRAGILGLFENELQTVDEDDGVVVFFAGHGITARDALGVDRGFLIPHDGVPTNPLRNLSVAYLRDELLPMIPAKHVFLIVDACYGGLALRDVRTAPRPAAPQRRWPRPARPRRWSVRSQCLHGPSRGRSPGGEPLRPRRSTRGAGT